MDALKGKLHRDIVQISQDEQISDLVIAGTFAEIKELYPESYDFLEVILVDWLKVEMPMMVNHYGLSRCMATVMGLIELNAAKIQARQVNENRFQFRVVFEDDDLLLKMLERRPQ